MNTNFQISGLNKDYNHLFELSQSELAEKGVVKMIVDEKPGYPCRVSLEDAEIGEEVILFSYEHHKTESPYQAMGPVFIRKNAKKVNLGVGEIPKMLLHRSLSLRIYNSKGMMIGAKTIEGNYLEKEIVLIFKNELADYIQVHNSTPGCYNCQINRVD